MIRSHFPTMPFTTWKMAAETRTPSREGDTLSVRDCLYLLLMRSSNQAANALAEHVGGSRDGFVKMMNEKTAELGCENSHFANPSGLNDDTQLTSVYDMALIASAAYKNDTLLTISKDKSYRLPATKNNPDGVTIQPEHKLLITTDTESRTIIHMRWPERPVTHPLQGRRLLPMRSRMTDARLRSR